MSFLRINNRFCNSICYNNLLLQLAGVDDNETIKVFRSGGADPDGDQPGDLYVTIKVN